jgi:methyl-accepting chemotaxis protein
MNRISLKAKIRILSGILMSTTLAVALVGGMQLSQTNDLIQRLTSVTNRSMDMTASLRVLLLTAVRSEKNAVIAPSDEETLRFASVANKAVMELQSLLPKLQDLIDSSPDSGEQQQLAEFLRGWQAFVANQKDVLDLAVQNTNVKGQALLQEEIREQLDAIEGLLAAVRLRQDSQEQSQEAPVDAQRARALRQLDHHLANAMIACNETLNLLYAHLNSPEDSEMNQLDTQIAASQSKLETSLQQAKLLVDEVDRPDVSQAITEIQPLRKLIRRLQELSRTNSNVRSSNLTLTKTVALTTECDSSLERLLKILQAKVESGRNAVSDAYQRALAIIGGATVFGTLIGILLAHLITQSITIPAAKGVELAHALAQGDLTRRLNLSQDDELGRLTRAIDQAADNFARIISEIHAVSEQIGASSSELGAVSHELLSQSEEMSTQATFVAGSTEQMTTNINTMAAAAEEMSMNVASISSASEEISVNVGSISQAAGDTSTMVGSVVETIQEATLAFKSVSDDASEGARISAKAAELATHATQSMSALDRSASDINKVTEMIKLIAMQTNLLALNATIEATSAGEAGKGFAVVANEIKQLANQSGKAAEDIARMIEGIQQNTRSAVAVIEGVAETISTTSTASDRIFKAVDNQSQTAAASAEKLRAAGVGVGHIAHSITEVAKGANDMSRNASEAAKAATDVSHNASEAARAVREVSTNIRGVSEATKHNAASAEQVNQAATRLQSISANLEQIVRRFRVNESIHAR